MMHRKISFSREAGVYVSKTWPFFPWLEYLPILCVPAFLFLIAPLVWTAKLPLEATAEQWQEILFLDESYPNITASQAVVFDWIEEDAGEQTLRIGPWHAGNWSARLQYKKRLPWSGGTIRGMYKTSNLLPFQAQITVSFYRQTEHLGKITHALAPAPLWRPFEFAIRNPPAGADSFVPAFGLGDKTSGYILFKDLMVLDNVSEVRYEDTGWPLRMAPFKTFEPSDRYRLEKDGQNWWLISPEGKCFYSIGTVGPNLSNAIDRSAEGLKAVQTLREYGFNSLAGWTNPTEWLQINQSLEVNHQSPLPLFCFIQTNTLQDKFDFLVDSQGNTGPAGHAFPDPFDPVFEEAYALAAQKIQEQIGDKSWFVGWFADNELSHEDLYRYVYSTHCAKAFLEYIQKRYPRVEFLNDTWKTHLTSFEDLLVQKPSPSLPVGPMAADFLAFERRIVQHYIDVTLRTIRRLDSQRPIFSNRFMASGVGAYARVLDLYSRYDGIGVNLYPSNQSPGLNENETAYLNLFHAFTQKPVLVSEWSVPAMDSGLYDPASSVPLDWSYNEAVATQNQRARQAAHVALDLYNLPFVVGSHWFTWQDIDNPNRRANRGLFTADNQPWSELLHQFGQMHRKINR
ncbi:MAG: beta-galactosidase [Sedimentisphaerales bacterium]|nr:beta-galactosidase [Sedimentisphaerales bacterium]